MLVQTRTAHALHTACQHTKKTAATRFRCTCVSAWQQLRRAQNGSYAHAYARAHTHALTHMRNYAQAGPLECMQTSTARHTHYACAPSRTPAAHLLWLYAPSWLPYSRPLEAAFPISAVCAPLPPSTPSLLPTHTI